MNKREAKMKVHEMLTMGRKKSEVFDVLSGQGVKAQVLARLIASHLDPRRYAETRIHVRIAIAFLILQLLFLLAVCVNLALTESMVGAAFLGLFLLVFQGSIIWGLVVSNACIYNVVLLLSVTELGRQSLAFLAHRGSSILAFAISLSFYAYLMFIRRRLFPDFNFITPRKQGGRYVFRD